MKISDVKQDLVVFQINFEKRPDKYKLSRDTNALLLFLLSQRATDSKADFEYTNDPNLFYKETFTGLSDITNGYLLSDDDINQTKISIRGPVINTLYGKPPLKKDTNYAGILEMTLGPIEKTGYGSEYKYAMGVMSRFIMAVQVHCKETGIFIADTPTGMLKNYPEKAVLTRDWEIYRDSEDFHKLYIFVPAEMFAIAKQLVPAAISDATPSYVLSCPKVKDSFTTVKKPVKEFKGW